MKITETIIGIVCCGAAIAYADNDNIPNFAETQLERIDEESETVDSYVLKVNGAKTTFDVSSVFAMPSERVRVEIINENQKDSYSIEATDGDISENSRRSWDWVAPTKPGLTLLTLTNERTREMTVINGWTMVPANEVDNNGLLNGYRIGRYPEPRKGSTQYLPPKGFIEVSKANKDTLLSPNLKLSQFLCKQASGWPKYVVIQPKLVNKLEAILGEAREHGIDADTLSVLSGYRTPYYNRSIGNVKYSRHMYGDAADVFIDTDGNGRMDDLNSDGRVTRADALTMAMTVDELVKRIDYVPYIGGLGIYGPKPHRGPFIHVDTRGYRARW